MADTYDHIKGKIILHAQLTAQEGQADKLASMLKAIQAVSVTDKEPGCLAYRVTRSGNEFFIFEEYQNAAAIQEHFGGEGFKNLVNEVKGGSLVVGGPRITYYEEI